MEKTKETLNNDWMLVEKPDRLHQVFARREKQLQIIADPSGKG